MAPSVDVVGRSVIAKINKVHVQCVWLVLGRSLSIGGFFFYLITVLMTCLHISAKYPTRLKLTIHISRQLLAAALLQIKVFAWSLDLGGKGISETDSD